jgi:hypothetical protein
MKRVAIVACLLLTAQALVAQMVYDEARFAVEGTKKLLKGSVQFEENHLSFTPKNELKADPVAVLYNDVVSMRLGLRKKKYGGATAATTVLAGPVGLVMLVANKKFTMVSIELKDASGVEPGVEFVTIGVRKRIGLEFVRRLEKVTGLPVEGELEEPEAEKPEPEEPETEGN